MPISQGDLFTVSRVTRVDQKSDANCQQLQPRKRHNQQRTLNPKTCSYTQGDHAQRQIKPAELGRRYRAIPAQKPVNAVTVYRCESKYHICHWTTRSIPLHIGQPDCRPDFKLFKHDPL
jgi:hypothetical protein